MTTLRRTRIAWHAHRDGRPVPSARPPAGAQAGLAERAAGAANGRKRI